MAGPITKTPVELIFDKGQANDEMLRAEQLSPRSVINGVFDGRGSLRQTRLEILNATETPQTITEAFQYGDRTILSSPFKDRYAAIDNTSAMYNFPYDGNTVSYLPTKLAQSEAVASFGVPYGGAPSRTDGAFDVLTDDLNTFRVTAQHQLPDTIGVGTEPYIKVTFEIVGGATVTTNIRQVGYGFVQPRLCFFSTGIATKIALYLWRYSIASPLSSSLVVYTITGAGVVSAQTVLYSFTAMSADYLGRSFDAHWCYSSGEIRVGLAFRYDSGAGEIILMFIFNANSATVYSTSGSATVAAITNHRAIFVNMDPTYGLTAAYTADRYLRKVKLTFAGSTLTEGTIADTGAATRIVGRACHLSGDYGGQELILFDWYDNVTGQTSIELSTSASSTTAAGTNSSYPIAGVLGSKLFCTSDYGVMSSEGIPVLTNGHSLSTGLYGNTESSLDILTGITGQFTGGGYYAQPRVLARLGFGENLVLGLGTLSYMSRLPNSFMRCVPSARISRSVETVSSTEEQVNFRFNVVLTDLTKLGAAGCRRNSITIGDSLLISGACPTLIADNSDSASSFSARPYLYAAASSGAVSVITAGTHRVRVVESFVNAVGDTIKSEPSNYISFVAGAAHNALSVSYNRADNGIYGKDVSFEIYRTTIDDLNTYYLDSPTAPLSDANLVYGAHLPTTGGALPAEPAPACTFLAIHQNRVFACGGEFGNELYFTHELQPGFLPEWSQTYFFRRAPKDFGRLVSMISIDDRLIVFGEHKIGIISGTGPDRTGAGDGYSQIQTIVGGFGCSIKAPLSPVAIETGIWFEAERGMRFLGRNLQIEKDDKGNWLGDSLDNIFDAFGWYATTETSAGITPTVIPGYGAGSWLYPKKGPRRLIGVPTRSKELIYWVPGEFWALEYTSNGNTVYSTRVVEAICFDTRSLEWVIRSAPLSTYNTPGRVGYVFDGYAGASFVTSSTGVQSLVLVPREGDLMTPTHDSELGTAAAMIVDTGWLGFAKVSGFQRIYDVTVLLRDAEDLFYANPSDSNAAASSPQTVTLTIESAIDFNANTWTTVFNAAVPVKSANSFVREVTCQLSTQKCESIRFRFTVAAATHPVRLTSARLTVGVKEGRNKGSLGRS